jgi:hypothetical protein
MNPFTSHPMLTIPAVSSPLMLSDRLIALAQDADRAGFAGTADRLVRLAYAVFDEPARPSH